MATLEWTKIDADGSLFARGKQGYYAIIVRGIPKERPKDGVVELFVTNKEVTFSELKYSSSKKLLSRIVVVGSLESGINIEKAIDNLKGAAERREKTNSFGSINSGYSI